MTHQKRLRPLKTLRAVAASEVDISEVLALVFCRRAEIGHERAAIAAMMRAIYGEGEGEGAVNPDTITHDLDRLADDGNPHVPDADGKDGGDGSA